ncbi:MAG: MoaD/ThiS family protein [Promethearchaeota archaeon]|nr:MAG: MoaD/ThiS family protein [Candidatus Lokiarchaeota archaeon]
MSILVKLYGDLRGKISQSKSDPALPTTLHIEIDEIKTVTDVLNKLNIIQEEVSHVFLNNKYSTFGEEIKNRDRIGIFPKRMGLIFVEMKNPF